MYLSPIDRYLMPVRLVAPSPELVTKTCEGLLAIPRHQEMHLPCLVVPIYCDSRVFGALPVVCDFVMLAEDAQQVFSILFANIFNTKIINY